MAELEEESEKKSGQGKYEWKLEIKHVTEFSGDHKKEDPNNEERVLSEIKIAGMEEPAEENMTKTSDNLEMADLTPGPDPDLDQDEEDININAEKWIDWYFVYYLNRSKSSVNCLCLISKINIFMCMINNEKYISIKKNTVWLKNC